MKKETLAGRCAIALVFLVFVAGLVTSWSSRRTDIGEALRVV